MNMVRLKVLSNYANQTVIYTKGSVVEVDDGDAGWLMADSPGTFKVEPEKKTAPAKDPKDKK